MKIDVYDDVNIDSSIFQLILDTKQELDQQGKEKPCFHQIHGTLDVEDWFFKHTGRAIRARDFWHNYICRDDIHGQKNHHEWHEDRYSTRLAESNEQRLERMANVEKYHANGEYTCVVWAGGENNQGGELLVITEDGIETVEFRKHRMVIFPIDAVHKVNEYDSLEYRISVLFTFDYLDELEA